jgi:hypothetical protein
MEGPVVMAAATNEKGSSETLYFVCPKCELRIRERRHKAR